MNYLLSINNHLLSVNNLCGLFNEVLNAYFTRITGKLQT